MANQLKITSARLCGDSGLKEVEIESGRIIRIAPTIDRDLPTFDLGGDWLSLGGVDLQINGALGLAFPDVTRNHTNQLDRICQFLWAEGVDGFLPTIVTTSIAKIHNSLAVFTDYARSQAKSGTARVLGVHLEGPCLNYDKRGAHPAEYLQPLAIESLMEILGEYSAIVKAITLAPELDPTGTAIPYLRSLGITVSLGHSQANYNQAERAYTSGASMVTHAFNAMPPLHHREPGLLGAALTHPGVRCGLIADGEHVHPQMLKLLLRAGRYGEGLFLVSDALSPLGLPDGKYPWDLREIEVINGTARLPDGTLSGTTLPLLTGVQNLVAWDVCEPEQAIDLATRAPREAIDLSGDYLGANAHNLLRWHLTGKNIRWERFLKS
jgi:N-acetylglucosamine-6-phosphate deacetylase